MRNLVFLIFILSFVSCRHGKDRPDIRNIEVKTPVQRFEQELFTLNPDTIADAIDYFFRKYDDFYEIFNYYIVDLGQPSDRAYSGYLVLFIQDDLNREVFEAVNAKFGDLKSVENEFNKAFRYFRYYFPERKIPRLVSYISRFNYSYFSVSGYIGIGLDMYLGADAGFYRRLGLPAYQVKNMIPEKIPSDALGNWANALFPFSDSAENVLSHLVHEGKLMYFLDRILPDQPDNLKFGFSKEQMKWCIGNERQMWTYLVENKLVFSTDPMDIRKLVSPAPFTTFFSNTSPGRAAVWVGYQIVKEYSRRNPELSLSDIMQETDYQEILRLSRYNP